MSAHVAVEDFVALGHAVLAAVTPGEAPTLPHVSSAHDPRRSQRRAQVRIARAEAAIETYGADGYGVTAASDWRVADAYAFIDQTLEFDGDNEGFESCFEAVALSTGRRARRVDGGRPAGHGAHPDDLDGDVDVYAFGFSSGTPFSFLKENDGAAAFTDLEADIGPGLTLADMNGDGAIDLVSIASGQLRVALAQP